MILTTLFMWGVRYLADCLDNANVESPADTENLYLAIQSYNFGLDYIDWALSNFGGYSKTNAQVYLDMKIYEDSSFTGNANYVANVWIYYRGSSSRIVEIENLRLEILVEKNTGNGMDLTVELYGAPVLFPGVLNKAVI